MSGAQGTYENAPPPMRVVSIKNGREAETTFEYMNSSDCEETILSYVTHPVKTIETKVKNADGEDLVSTTTYSYSGGKFDHETREFRGFRTVTKTNPDGSKEKTDFHQTEFLKGRMKKVELIDTEGAIMEKTDYTWETYSSGSNDPWKFVRLSEKRVEKYDQPDVVVFNQEDYSYNNTHGSLNILTKSGTDGEDINIRKIRDRQIKLEIPDSGAVGLRNETQHCIYLMTERYTKIIWR